MATRSLRPFIIAVVYKSTGVASISLLIGYVDFAPDQTVPNGATFTLQWGNTDCVFKVTAT